MKEEVEKAVNSAINNNFVKRLSLYLHDCIREEVQSSTFRNLKQDKDNKWIFLEAENTVKSDTPSILDGEKLFSSFPEYLKMDGADPFLTELMLQSNNSLKDKYLIYGYMFLVGKNAKTKRKNEFLTPLLYSPCTLERSGENINCIIQDDNISLNTAALTSLMNIQGEDEETDSMLDGLLEVVPKLPLKEEDLNVFLTTLRSLIPDLKIEFNSNDEIENNIDSKESSKSNLENQTESSIEESDNTKTKNILKADKVILTNKSAIILTKRPVVTAGLLYELTQIADKSSGTIRETSLNVINESYLQSIGKMPSKILKENNIDDFVPITPLSLSDAQENVIKNLNDNTVLSVYGPPGTGKSQTIVNLICHLISTGKTVLVASRMDKAADVIADRINGFGAPFLALRAGRANYQKQLSNDLQELISGKKDLDTGFEDSILVDVEDMVKLICSIKNKEKKCIELLKYEENWSKLYKESDITNKIIGKIEILNKRLSPQQIEDINTQIKIFEKYAIKRGIIAKLFRMITNSKLNKILNRKKFKLDLNNLQRIKLELESAKLSVQLRDVEYNLNKYGEINELLTDIKNLKKKQKILAIDILKGKRRNSLKSLLRDQVKRQRLIEHTKALVTKKQNLQYRLLEKEDFKPLLEAFPCWCVTSYAVSNSLPLKPAMFDVAIIDEASQCDIASCIPILYRCKKAVIVGDDKQLPHLSFLEKSKEQSFMSQYEIPDKYRLMWSFRTNSMFDLANYYSMNPVLLDEHFRSAFPIIEFSNKEFYSDKIRIMTQQTEKKPLELIIVPDGKSDSDITRNTREVEAIMQRLQELLNEDNNKKESNTPVSIGIVSPFRGQVELIKKALSQLYPDSLLKKHKIEVGTAHTFQGDERDIMMVSWAIANNSFNQSLTFLQIPNLFNVAITRAKKKQIVFLSKDPKSLPAGLLKDYIEYIQSYINISELKEFNQIDENSYKNDFEREIANELRKEDFEVTAGKLIAGVESDLYISSKSGRSIIVECDGIPDETKFIKSPVKKQTLMERAGITVERLSYRQWQLSKKGCIDRIKNILNSDV